MSNNYQQERLPQAPNEFTPVTRTTSSYSENNPFAELAANENQAQEQPITVLTTGISNASLDSPQEGQQVRQTQQVQRSQRPILNVDTEDAVSNASMQQFTPIIQIDPPSSFTTPAPRLPPPLPPLPSRSEIGSPNISRYAASFSTNMSTSTSSLGISSPSSRTPVDEVVSLVDLPISGSHTPSQVPANAIPIITVDSPIDDTTSITTEDLTEEGPTEEELLEAARLAQQQDLQDEEEHISRLPPSPVYTFEASPGELSIPNNQAIDPLSINESTPEEDPPEYTELSPEAAQFIIRPQFSQTGGNIMTPSSLNTRLNGTQRYTRPPGPPPTPARPPAIPPRQRPFVPASSGRMRSSTYQRPPKPPPQHILQQSEQRLHQHQGVVHPVVAPPLLPRRPVSPNSSQRRTNAPHSPLSPPINY